MTERSPSSLSSELLDLARSEQPQAAVQERAIEAALQALRGAGPVAVATGASLSARALYGWLTLGGLSAAALGVWLFAGGQRGSVSSTQSPRAIVNPAPAACATAAVTVVPSAEAPRSDGARESAPIPALAPSAARNPSSASAKPEGSVTRSSDGLEREIQILDRARRLLAAGDAAQARRTIEQAPFRSLAPEAEALTIEALVASGDRARADRLVERFLQQHPASPLAARVAALRSSGKGTP